MDKRRKHIDRQAEHALRQQFYERIQRDDISVAEAVKSMRRISLLTQAEFAKHRGVSLRVLKEIEAGTANPTLETLNRIGGIFGLRVGFVATPKTCRSGRTNKPGQTIRAVRSTAAVANSRLLAASGFTPESTHAIPIP